MRNVRVRSQKPLIVFILVVFYGCVAAQETRKGADVSPAAPEQTSSASQKTAVAGSGVEIEAPAVYQHSVTPLTTLQCAQCHESVFNDIKANGGKHQINCRECHESFHTYKPGKKWSEVVPQCVTCHGQAHGPSFPKCLACHADPHAPVASLVNLGELEKGCAACHIPQKHEIASFPSAHAEVSCAECHHTKHGYKPDCRECHEEPHTNYVDNAGCIACHPVHSPTQINYPATTANIVCSGCHEEVARQLESSHRKHSQKACVFCHVDRHGYIPECTKCHTAPHSKAMLQRFNNDCKECHGEPHALILPGHKD
jgi:predicted CXXCH cytochrome family protein